MGLLDDDDGDLYDKFVSSLSKEQEEKFKWLQSMILMRMVMIMQLQI